MIGWLSFQEIIVSRLRESSRENSLKQSPPLLTCTNDEDEDEPFAITNDNLGGRSNRAESKPAYSLSSSIRQSEELIGVWSPENRGMDPKLLMLVYIWARCTAVSLPGILSACMQRNACRARLREDAGAA